MWRNVASQEESPGNLHWQKVVALVQVDLRAGHLVEEFICQTIMIIPKGHSEFCGIGLVELLWKTVAGITNHRLTLNIAFHDTLHVFHAGRGKGNAHPEANLLQKLTAMREDTSYQMFLNLHKAYGVLEREMCLHILGWYGAAPQALCLLRTYLECLTITAKAGIYHARPFRDLR